MESEEERKSGSLFQCCMCEKGFETDHELTSHLHHHNLPKVYKCDLCSETFYFPSSLSNHVRIAHTELTKLVRCRVCLVTFSDILDLQRHIALKHNRREQIKKRHIDKSVNRQGVLRNKYKIRGSKVCDNVFRKQAIKPMKNHVSTKSTKKQNSVMRETDVATEADENLSQSHHDTFDKTCIDFTTDTEEDGISQTVVSSFPQSFDCKDCGRLFASSHGLACHRNRISLENMYSVDCENCHIAFDSLNLLACHIRTSSSCKGFKCPICPFIFETESIYLRHLARHEASSSTKASFIGSVSELKCSHCSKVFLTAGQYIRHAHNHAKSTPYRCKSCSNRFSTFELLLRHMKSKHKVQAMSCSAKGESSGEKEETVNTIIRSEGYSVHCIRCLKHCDSIDALREHSQSICSATLQCVVCCQMFQCQSDLVEHEIENHFEHLDSGELECHRCHETLLSNSECRTHLAKHFDFKSVICSHCQESFVSVAAVKAHLKDRHQGVDRDEQEVVTQEPNSEPKVVKKCKICGKEFRSIFALRAHETKHRLSVCNSCNQCFSRQSKLQHHKHLVHNEPILYICQFCPKTFNRAASQRRHERLHKDKSYQCQHCAKMFVCAEHMKSHLRVHSAEKPYKCPHCSFTCRFQSGLHRHVKTHDTNQEKIHTCSTCGKSFRTRHNLVQHCKLHGKKSYSCEMCGAAFARKDYLENHFRVHSMVKPFSCPVCGQSFAVASNMNSHIKRLHPDFEKGKQNCHHNRSTANVALLSNENVCDMDVC